MSQPTIRDVEPREVWDALEAGDAVMIDVRTRAEWSFVGLPLTPDGAPETALIEWQSFPTMEVNPSFAEAALAAVEEAGASTAYFLCRSGVRSLHAAVAAEAAARAAGRTVECVNISRGFEGAPDEEGHRGRVNGWKAQGLPWPQS